MLHKVAQWGKPFLRARQQAAYHSPFGGLWIDRADALKQLDKKLGSGLIKQEQAEQVAHFIAYGFVIIPNAVPPALIDALNADIDKAWHNKNPHLVVQTAHDGYQKLSEASRMQTLVKLLDAYAWSTPARQVSFAPAIRAFLQAIFEGDVQAFQSLGFEVGSTQAMHQDGTYVVLNEPMKFAASWVACEDIEEGSGELVYYPRSHRFPSTIFSGKHLHWIPQRDGYEVHQRYLQRLHEMAQELGIALATFRPKKGDALIWHAGLVHGGGAITKAGATRKSYVTHYCPHGVRPNYYTHNPAKAIARQVEGGYISSEYYDV